MGNFLYRESESSNSPQPEQLPQSVNESGCIAQAASVINPSIFLNEILRQIIRIDPGEERISKRIVTEFLSKLTSKLQETDSLFSALFQKIYYTGSYYEDLRVSNATEFDINLVLKFPFASNERTIECSSTVKSFAKYKVKDSGAFSNPNHTQEKRQLYERIKKTFFEGNYLLPSKVIRWMQSILDKPEVLTFNVEGVSQIRKSSSGPARTILLYTNYGYEIDIDLVPVIEISHPEWPSGADRSIMRNFNVPGMKQFWFLVPKKYEGDNENLRPEERERFWRMHFPEIEKTLLHDRGLVKPVIKLLKVLRDKQDWKILSSYYLKTVVMWMVVENPNIQFWKPEVVWTRIVEVLEKLQGCVERKEIPYLFYPEYNLLNKLRSDQATNIVFRLKRIIRDVRTSYRNIESYIRDSNRPRLFPESVQNSILQDCGSY